MFQNTIALVLVTFVTCTTSAKLNTISFSEEKVLTSANTPSKQSILQNVFFPNTTGVMKASKSVKGIPSKMLSKIRDLQEEVQMLREQMENHYNDAHAILGDGWITPYNGYQYKLTSHAEPWSSSRATCQAWGGDLAVYGMKEFGSRKTILRALGINLNTEKLWIGLSETDQEGIWRWMNGELVDDASTFWLIGEPNNHNGISEDCGQLIPVLYVNDSPCSLSYVGICEKPYN